MPKLMIEYDAVVRYYHIIFLRLKFNDQPNFNKLKQYIV
jgi:hypothetical protein